MAASAVSVASGPIYPGHGTLLDAAGAAESSLTACSCDGIHISWKIGAIGVRSPAYLDSCALWFGATNEAGNPTFVGLTLHFRGTYSHRVWPEVWHKFWPGAT